MLTSALFSDLNGTLTRYDTMPDLAQRASAERYASAHAIFLDQTSGLISPEESIRQVARLTEGLTLKDAIDYSSRLKYVDGFDELISALHGSGTALVLNSTGYSVTFYAMRHSLNAAHRRRGDEVLHGWIGNSLLFADGSELLGEEMLEDLVGRYLSGKGGAQGDLARYTATGEVDIRIAREADKFTHLERYKEEHFPDMAWQCVSAMGDSYTDNAMLLGVAQRGGRGIAFNFNPMLERRLRSASGSQDRIFFIEKKAEYSNLAQVSLVLDIGNP